MYHFSINLEVRLPHCPQLVPSSSCSTQIASGPHAEAEIQVYVNMRKTFIELESQGAYTTLQPGEELKWTVTWYLLPYDGKAEPGEALKKKIKSIVG